MASTPTRIIAFMNQKGGVGKTTTAVNLGAALAEAGQRVLMIDMDPQAHLTLHLGVDPDAVERSVYDLLAHDEVSAAELLTQAGERLWLLPAEVNLAGVETEMAPKMATGQAQRALASKCGPLLVGADGQAAFDFVIIDCPPSLGLLTINSLIFATEVIVPMQAHFLALQGLSKLLETVSLIRQSFNPRLTVSGIVLCMFESQTIHAQAVIADIRDFLDASRHTDQPYRDAVVLAPAVRRNIKLAECPSFGQHIFQYEPTCAGAEDYRGLARAVMGEDSGFGVRDSGFGGEDVAEAEEVHVGEQSSDDHAKPRAASGGADAAPGARGDDQRRDGGSTDFVIDAGSPDPPPQIVVTAYQPFPMESVERPT